MPSTWEVITLVIADYGAVLSSYLGIRHLRSQKPKMSVTHGWSYGEDVRVPTTPKYLHLHAVNTGNPDIVIQILALDIPNFMILTPGFLAHGVQSQYSNFKGNVQGRRLKAGDKIEICFDYTMLLEFFEKRKLPLRVRAVCEDTLENWYNSEWFEMDMK